MLHHIRLNTWQWHPGSPSYHHNPKAEAIKQDMKGLPGKELGVLQGSGCGPGTSSAGGMQFEGVLPCGVSSRKSRKKDVGCIHAC